LWNSTFDRWNRLKGELVDHARRVLAEYRPFGPGEARLVAAGIPHADFCIRASIALLQATAGHRAWLESVEGAVVRLDEAAVAVRKLTDDIRVGDWPEDEVTSRIERLFRSYLELVELYRGREVFNPDREHVEDKQ
jgi:hypothetical protein